MFTTNIKKQGGSKMIIIPKAELEKAGIEEDVLIGVELKKYKSSYQDLFERYKQSQSKVSIQYDNEEVTGMVLDCTQEKVKIKSGDEVTILFYQNIDDVNLVEELK